MKSEVSKASIATAGTPRLILTGRECKSVRFHITVLNPTGTLADVEISIGTGSNPVATDAVATGTKVPENGGTLFETHEGVSLEKIWVKSSVTGLIVRVVAKYDFEV